MSQPVPLETHPLARCGWCGRGFVRGLLTVAGLTPWVCPTEGCWRRQVAHAMTVTLKGQARQCRFVPLPRQVDLLEAVEGDGPARYLLMGGAAGGSKSKILRELAHRTCLSRPHMRVLLLRRTYRELEDTHLREVEVEAPQMGAQAVPSAKVVRYPNGSILRFGHCETTADASGYLSAEFDLILFDELVTFEETQFLLISSRARTSKPHWRPRIVAGTNPGGPQSHWVRQRFLDKTVDRDTFPDYRPEEWVFLPSKLEDNPYLSADYERTLLNLPVELRQAYRDGDWDIFPGQYFREWSRKAHVTATPLVFPPEAERVLSMDWGFVQPGVVGWWVLHDGKAYREDEYVFTRTTAFEVGKEIVRRCQERGVRRIKYLVFDTAMLVPNNDTGESTIESVRRGMRKAGLSIATRPADKDRINGWQRLRHWLRPSPDGTPWLQVSPLCTYFIRTLPAMVSDDHRPEDLDTTGEDHACFVADTPILTKRGVQPIAQVALTDEVWTRQGWKPVEAVAITAKDAPLVTAEFSDGRTLTGTPNHPVWTENRGFVRLDELRYDDMLVVCPDARSLSNASPIAASSFAATRTLRAWKIGGITNRVAHTFTAAWKPSIAKCGRTRTGRFLTVITSTIAMAIRRTTPSTIWRASLRPIISRSMAVGRRLTSITWPPFAPWLCPGIGRRLAVAGIAPRLDSHGLSASRCGRSAWSVTRPTTTSRAEARPASVATPARVRSVAAPAWMTWTEPVASVAPSFASTDTAAPSAARDGAVRVRGFSPAGTGTVYNLTVADCHEYFANGVLVSNCDEARYFVMSRPTPGQQAHTTTLPPNSLKAWDTPRPPGLLGTEVRLA